MKILIALKRAGRDPGHGILAAALFPIDGLRNMKLRQGAVLRLTAGDLNGLIRKHLIIQESAVISIRDSGCTRTQNARMLERVRQRLRNLTPHFFHIGIVFVSIMYRISMAIAPSRIIYNILL